MFSTEYSLWFLPLCLLLGAGYAAILYVKADKPELPMWVKRTAFAARLLVVSLLAFLLLNPIVKHIAKEVEKPIVLVGIDNSASLEIGEKSAYYKGGFQNELQNLLKNLAKDYTVEPYLLGDSLREGSEVDFSDKQTNLSAFFEQIETVYANRNVGAVVLLSDGIFNTGSNPYYVANNLKQPIYTVAMGDTTVHKDILIAKVNHNRTVYRGNAFPLEILVNANKFSGKSTQMNIFQDGELVYEKTISFKSDNYSEWVRVNFDANKSGLLRYRIQLLPLEGEITKDNNTKDVFVEVIDQRKKIAIIYNSPHPDVAAISEALKKNDAYQVEAFAVNKFTGKISEYEMVVLHQLPSVKNQAVQIINEIKQLHIPVFYILGTQTNYPVFNGLNTGVQVTANKDMSNDAFAAYNQNFASFSVSSSIQQLLPVLPPVKAAFGSFKVSPSSSTLLYQKIGSVSTFYPLFVFNQDATNRSVVFLGDGLWRWRMYNYLYENKNDDFDELIFKTFQFLSIKADRSLFRVNGKTVYSENEPIRFDAELYNQNYELVNEPEVLMTISQDGKNYPFTFSRNFKSYELNIGTFAEGDYHWEATTAYNNERYSKSGRFSVQKINLEAINLAADYQLMYNLASLNGGKCFPDDSLSEIYQTIKDNAQIKSIAHYNKKFTSLLDSLWLLLLIFAFLATEWVLRKWSGAY
ncbi:MAG: hypothetical protein FWH36_09520 [Lentimicrobiaceae bacterium]|nr:hypothetical protein [Lentimicrobiaceae bacterium]